MNKERIRVDLVMPAYNEEENIEKVIEQWYPIVEKLNQLGNIAHLVIANDGSKDFTMEKILSFQKKFKFLIPLNKKNSGHGATVLYLYRYAIKEGADFIFQTDSDGQTEPEEFWRMWENRNNYDFQIGNRYKREDGLSRIIVTKVLKTVVRLTFGVSVPDANTPFRLMNSKSLEELMTFIPQDFFLSNVAISAFAVRREYQCRWIPITFKPRQGGVNSINLKRIFKIGTQAIGDFRELNKKLNN